MRLPLPGLGVVWDSARGAARRFPEAFLASLATVTGTVLFRLLD